MIRLNKLLISGRLATEPEQRETAGGTNQVLYKIRENGTDNLWHCRSFAKIADFVCDRVEQDADCVFEGRLEQTPWTDDQGNDRRSISFRVTRVHVESTVPA